MFEPYFSPLVGLLYGAIIGTLTVGVFLRFVIGNPKLRYFYRETVIILGVFGVGALGFFLSFLYIDPHTTFSEESYNSLDFLQ